MNPTIQKAAPAAHAANGEPAPGVHTHAEWERELREAGTRLLDSTKDLRSELKKQAQLHPLATFGVAFAAGVLLSRALRR